MTTSVSFQHTRICTYVCIYILIRIDEYATMKRGANGRAMGCGRQSEANDMGGNVCGWEGERR